VPIGFGREGGRGPYGSRQLKKAAGSEEPAAFGKIRSAAFGRAAGGLGGPGGAPSKSGPILTRRRVFFQQLFSTLHGNLGRIKVFENELELLNTLVLKQKSFCQSSRPNQ
jgi:hypothetical protein